MSHPYRKRVFGRYTLLAGLISWHWSAPCLSAEAGMDVTLNANIVENTCQVSIPGDGKIHLPIVGKNWFYNADGSTRLQPSDAASGTAFTVKVDSCPGEGTQVNRLKFSFQPQSKTWPADSRQIFINETSVDEGGAANTGVVIFSTDLNTNVLNTDGSSSVVLNAKTVWATEYDFYARLQNFGPVSAGKVTSRVLVNATYE
ncbi:fimbrial protein [Enterobacter bugandensis]|uniref:fimbrial-like protein n=2 Tax=Enterobacter TaxID=547 RepID=UPI00092E8900|nr:MULTISPECIES: fimbrial-like protein [Enterobacter]EKS6889251.1 fimbrial protein [Enterobacter bugandensis]EKS6931437.1 fimbrial protein [Enterobacter bugandensis]EKS7120853.1 fimbrial protein [Enterobacter bugandensis]EKV5174599.1 fimbrial protein [Enterobacter bugandensis]EMC1015779.1 fimbrial protein [Enterobacter bugandensis]